MLNNKNPRGNSLDATGADPKGIGKEDLCKSAELIPNENDAPQQWGSRQRHLAGTPSLRGA
jgi:hypothetical protein